MYLYMLRIFDSCPVIIVKVFFMHVLDVSVKLIKEKWKNDGKNEICLFPQTKKSLNEFSTCRISYLLYDLLPNPQIAILRYHS